MDVFTPTLCSLECDSSMMNNVMGNKSVFGHCFFSSALFRFQAGLVSIPKGVLCSYVEEILIRRETNKIINLSVFMIEETARTNWPSRTAPFHTVLQWRYINCHSMSFFKTQGFKNEAKIESISTILENWVADPTTCVLSNSVPVTLFPSENSLSFDLLNCITRISIGKYKNSELNFLSGTT